jgi:hypothetical protein
MDNDQQEDDLDQETLAILFKKMDRFLGKPEENIDKEKQEQGFKTTIVVLEQVLIEVSNYD